MRTLQLLQVMLLALLAIDNCYGQLTCITIPVQSSCQDEFGNDPGDTACSGNPCTFDGSDFVCGPFDPLVETRSLQDWNKDWAKSALVDSDADGVWGRLAMVQCVASQKCDCNMVRIPDDIRCTLEGAGTQKALKFFFYARFVTEEPCFGPPQ